MSDLHIPSKLRPFFTPAQPAFDFYAWVPDGPEREPKSMRVADNAGKYDSNNGVLVVYDEVGDPFVASIKELNRHGMWFQDADVMLSDAGFKKASVYVPHSNDGGAFIVKMFPEELELKLVE